MGFKKFDELQLIKRGNIFKHCLCAIIILLFINLMLLELDISIMSQRNMTMCVIQFTVSLFCIEMIMCDIYPIGENRLRVLYLLCGLIGVALIGISLYDAIVQKEVLLDEGIINSTGSGLMMGALSLSIPIVYVGRWLYNKKHREE